MNMEDFIMQRELNKNVNIRVVTSNDLIVAKELSVLPLNSRKLLYLAISQCKRSDQEFFEYTMSIKDFAEMMDIDDSNVYRYGKAKKITGSLMGLVLECDLGDGYEQYSLFSKCSYVPKDGMIKFKLNPDMTKFLLNVNKNFSQPLLNDFLHMNSPYSMEIWHLMQREMKSKKPSMTEVFEFDLSLDELRRVTGTEEKLRQISQFKEKVLDKAIREIRDNCAVVIEYDNIKSGRRITGFHFMAKHEYHVDMSDISPDILKRVKETKKRLNLRNK